MKLPIETTGHERAICRVLGSCSAATFSPSGVGPGGDCMWIGWSMSIVGQYESMVHSGWGVWRAPRPRLVDGRVLWGRLEIDGGGGAGGAEGIWNLPGYAFRR